MDVRSTTPVVASPSSGVTAASTLQTPFAMVTQNLLNLGALSLERFVETPKADLEGFDLPFLAPHLDLTPTASALPNNEESSVVVKEEAHSSSTMQHVAQLHQTCQQAFGNSEALKFEFIEELGPNRKQCILTINRPNGVTRSYTTKAEFFRKSDAKARAANIAVDMGAVDFILYGNKDTKKAQKQLLLVPLDGSLGKKLEDDVQAPADASEEEDDLSKQIRDCCVEWRAGRVKPRWFFYNEPKEPNKTGCALYIELSPHSTRVYSVDAKFEERTEAKKECARLALDQDILEFIKHGNGQTGPDSTEIMEDVQPEEPPKTDAKGRPVGTSLQTFYETLPRPLPEPFGDKLASEINGPGWLNTTMQLAKGARLSSQFFWVSEVEARLSLHGCLLRLLRPDETRSYLVVPKFSKRADAKAAVCLLAMSQGIGQYVRGVAEAMNNKVTPDMIAKANRQILPVLTSEYTRFRPGHYPKFEWDQDKGAFGCSLTLSLSDDPKPEEIKTWTVPIEYRTKNHAKIAVVLLAAEDGAIEFVRFRGQPPPPGYDPRKPFKRIEDVAVKTDMPQRTGNLSGGSGDVKSEVVIDSPRSSPPKQAWTSGQVKLGVSNSNGEVRRRTMQAPRLSTGGNRIITPPVLPIAYQASAAQPAMQSKGLGPFTTRPPTLPPRPPFISPNPPLTSTPHGVTPPYDAVAATIERVTGGGMSQPRPPPIPPPPIQQHIHLRPLGMPPPPPLFHSQPGPPHLPPHYPPIYAPVIPISYPTHISPVQQPYGVVTVPPVMANRGPYHAQGQNPGQRTPDSYGRSDNAVNASNSPIGSVNGHGGITSTSNSKHTGKRPRSPSPAMKVEDTARPTQKARHTPPRPASTPDTSTSGTPERTSIKSNVEMLFDFCDEENVDRPTFFNESVPKAGTTVYKVWVILGKERLELPTAFETVNQGKERLAKQVLLRMRSKTRRGKDRSST
ncbi:hypothetical protein BD410DRAFT_844517 [Rickenella mellea]|uniref:Uncharacterized protein n=1 Tax=Rickenella mellea TaxID=50990 RepID=A0A4Y7PLJ5_9AGAM|nr:hypothetical protein BD410DRAFT_844517 [Rickenella mellea]